MTDKQIIDLTIIDQKYKDKCSLIKAGKCKNVNIFIEQSRKLKAKEQEVDVLKAENEELKKQIKIIDDEAVVVEISENQFEEYRQLKQTLDEIKEILLFNKKELEECLHNDIDGQILQKISEVEDGNN